MTYYCGECKNECGVHAEDFGIGSYEAWGAKGFDSRMGLSSDCCDGEVFEDEECTIESDYNEWAFEEAACRADYEYDRMRDDRLTGDA